MQMKPAFWQAWRLIKGLSIASFYVALSLAFIIVICKLIGVKFIF